MTVKKNTLQNKVFKSFDDYMQYFSNQQKTKKRITKGNRYFAIGASIANQACTNALQKLELRQKS